MRYLFEQWVVSKPEKLCVCVCKARSWYVYRGAPVLLNSCGVREILLRIFTGKLNESIVNGFPWIATDAEILECFKRFKILFFVVLFICLYWGLNTGCRFTSRSFSRAEQDVPQDLSPVSEIYPGINPSRRDSRVLHNGYTSLVAFNLFWITSGSFNWLKYTCIYA